MGRDSFETSALDLWALLPGHGRDRAGLRTLAYVYIYIYIYVYLRWCTSGVDPRRLAELRAQHC